MICCDFCFKSHHDAGQMITGPKDSHVAICDECAGLAVDVALEFSRDDVALDGRLGALKARWQQEACERVSGVLRNGIFDWDKHGSDPKESAANIAILVGNDIRNELPSQHHADPDMPQASTSQEAPLSHDEEQYWLWQAADADFSFWAEVEGAYRRACSNTVHGSFRVDQWITLASAVKEAIERYHGRKERLAPSEIRQLVNDIKELGQ